MYRKHFKIQIKKLIVGLKQIAWKPWESYVFSFISFFQSISFFLNAESQNVIEVSPILYVCDKSTSLCQVNVCFSNLYDPANPLKPTQGVGIYYYQKAIIVLFYILLFIVTTRAGRSSLRIQSEALERS